MKQALAEPTKTFVNAVIVTMNPEIGIIKNGFLTIHNHKITAMGEGAPETDEHLIDAKGKILMPGFVNAHTHLPMTMYRGIADDLPLKEWLEEHIWPAEAQHTHAETVRKATRLGLEEMVRTGTTTFSDMYFFADAVAEETEKFGLRGVMNEALLDFPTNSYANTDAAFKKIQAFIERWSGHALITPNLIFHATYTCSRSTILRLRELAATYNLQITSHVSETREEIQNVQGAQGMGPVAYLDSLDMVSGKLYIAHGVWLSEQDQNIFAQKGAHVVHCPSSNLKLGSGVAPIPDYLVKGINVALGTDGCASNNNLDMVEEMRLAALLHKGVNHNPTVIPAYEALKMATVNGAKALGMDDKIGSLEVGKLADILVIDTQNTFMQPIFDYYSALVYAMNSSCIESVLVNGKAVMVNKQLFVE